MFCAHFGSHTCATLPVLIVRPECNYLSGRYLNGFTVKFRFGIVAAVVHRQPQTLTVWSGGVRDRERLAAVRWPGCEEEEEEDIEVCSDSYSDQVHEIMSGWVYMHVTVHICVLETLECYSLS